MTKRVYYDDAYLTECDSKVLATKEEGGRFWAALDRTVFYPTGGGQPHDTGIWRSQDEQWLVSDVEVDDQGLVWHQLDKPISVGIDVKGTIDWARRFDHMQQHGGEHLLASSLLTLFSGLTIGLHVGEHLCTIDVKLPDGTVKLSDSDVDRLEMLVNERIQKDVPIKAWFPDDKELASLPLRKEPTVTEHVRVVAAGDFEMVACGGTHPARSGEIGLVKVLSTAPARGLMRVSFVCGMRAIRWVNACARAANAAGAVLSSPVLDLDAAAERLLKDKDDLQYQLNALRKEQVIRWAGERTQEATVLPDGTRLVTGTLPDATPELLKDAALALIAQPNTLAFFSGAQAEAELLVLARSSDLTIDLRPMMRALDVRGGGRPDFVQGKGGAGMNGLADRAADIVRNNR